MTADHEDVLQGQTQTLSNHASQISALESQQPRSNEVRRLQDHVTTKLSQMDLRFQVLETASYDGVLLWKIRDYRRRKEEARAGGILSLYSQAFYTSRHGYRMCARVYLNGDGMGQGTHLSLFFVVMKGEYDALLKWPFRQRVSLMLLDQTTGSRNMVDTFRPDPSSSSFQKPVNDMNIASGCPLFVSHNVLEAPDSVYLKDDTIFIKIDVDTKDLVNWLLCKVQWHKVVCQSVVDDKTLQTTWPLDGPTNNPPIPHWILRRATTHTQLTCLFCNISIILKIKSALLSENILIYECIIVVVGLLKTHEGISEVGILKSISVCSGWLVGPGFMPGVVGAQTCLQRGQLTWHGKKKQTKKRYLPRILGTLRGNGTC